MQRILIISNTNKLPNRLITFIEQYGKYNSIFLVNWQRDENTKNNFDNIPYINIKSKRGIKGLFRFYSSIKQLVNFENFDILYCFDYRMLIIVKIISQTKRIPCIFDVMEFNSYYIAIKINNLFRFLSLHLVQGIFEALEMRMLKLTDGVFVVDSKNNVLLDKVRKVQSNCACIMNYPSAHVAVDENEIKRFAKRFAGRNVVIYAGSIFGGKGLYRYIELIRRLRQEDPTVVLVIVGGLAYGEDWQNIERIMEEERLEEHVQFLPWMKYSTLLALLRNARIGLSLLDPDFFYYRRTSVGNSRKTFTYLQAGVPVLVSLKPVGNLVESHGVGRYVDYADEEAIFVAAKEILLDDELFEQMSLKAKELVERECNWENELPKVVKVFARALATRAR